LASQLDHHVILPLEHPTISVDTSAPHEVLVTFEDRRWVFPADDCVLLPISNTTAELLACHLARQLAEIVREWAPDATWLEIGVDENEGQWGVFRMMLS
jgi:6-pyruvoyltetrahydropterin/6-carboxytetrahydropterin synthase